MNKGGVGDFVDKFNKSQKAKAWAFTIITYIVVLLGNPFNKHRLLGSLEFGIGLIGALGFTFLHLKSLITKQDVWKNINFGLINSEEELKESERVKKTKKQLMPIVWFGLVFLLVFAGFSLILVFVL